jgi:hypothetical protein
MVKTKWLASLSDGTLAIEGVEPFADVAGELSPWQKLLAYLEPHTVYITGMRVQVFKDGEATRTYNLPSFNKTPEGNHQKWTKLRPFDPHYYTYRRWVTCSSTTEKDHHQIEVRAHYVGYSVSLFVDEDEGNECWVVVHA